MQNDRQAIWEAVSEVARQRNPAAVVCDDAQHLIEDLGLRSLDLAVIVARLEVHLGLDPFEELVPVTSIHTVGDLCAAYATARAAKGDSRPSPPETPGR